LREKWLLRVLPARGRSVAVWVDRLGKVSLEEVAVFYPLYLTAPKEETLLALAESLESLEGVGEARLEKWLAPPWYDREVPVLRVVSKDLSLLRKIAGDAERRGIAREVNAQPGSFLLGLREAGLRPCFWSGEPPESTAFDIPPLKVLKVTARGSGRFCEVLDLGAGERMLAGECGSAGDFAELLEESHVVIDELGSIPERLAGWRPLLRVGRNPVADPYGLIELCKISGMDLEGVSKSSIGKILTTVEAFRAVELRMLVPRVRAGRDGWRCVDELLEGDRGGLIGSPSPGVYFNVAQLDFSSLYPSIIAKYNISPETVNRPGCANLVRPFDSPHGVCADRPGLVAEAIRGLVERRELIRSLNTRESRYREKAIKWILVASFGYLGYRNSRFGNVHAYEVVTWVAREVLKKALECAERRGYEVVHFIVDSVFVTKRGEPTDRGDLLSLAKELEEATGFRIKLENVFKWLVIPETASAGTRRGASNRYYGLTVEGELVVKGSVCGWAEARVESAEKEKKLLEFLIKHNRPRRLCEDLKANAEELGLSIARE